MPADVFQKISNGYYRLTTAERKVADYVVLHPEECQYMSISELAEACAVAEATVTRFCRRLRFPGYGGFKIALATAAVRAEAPRLTGEVAPEDSIEDMLEKLHTAHADALDRTKRLLEPGSVRAAADLFRRARSVRCMGQGGSMIMASEAAHLFSTVSSKFVSVQDSHRQAIAAALLEPEDVIWFFSYSGSTRDILDLMELARERKCGLVLVTHYPKSPGAALADVVLQCGASEGPLQLGSVPARMAQLFIIDAVFHEDCRRDMTQVEKNSELVAKALAQKHI